MRHAEPRCRWQILKRQSGRCGGTGSSTRATCCPVSTACVRLVQVGFKRPAANHDRALLMQMLT